MSSNKLIPELRFPEFKNDGEWKKKRLDEVLTFQTGYPFDSAGFNDVGNGLRLIKNRDLKSNDKPVFYSKPFDEKFIVENDDILIGMDGDFSPCKWNEGKALLNQRVGRILTHNKGEEEFFYHFLSIQLKVIEEKTARTTVKHLSHSDVEKIFEPLPTNTDEQQKIASCLSSLDEVIAAHNQKLELLKDHKKGLMQNLFPQEGETVPKWRFKEFENNGEWVEKELLQVAKYENGKAHENDIDKDGVFIVVNSKFISTDGETVKYSNAAYCLANKGDILMVLSDVPNGRAIAKCFFVNEENKFTVNQRICRITPFDCDNLFLYYTMNRSPYFLSFDDGVKQTNLRNEDVQTFPFFIPNNKTEQERISSSLSSLDSLITAQAEKIEQLKLHKKGLMQGLFPKIND